MRKLLILSTMGKLAFVAVLAWGVGAARADWSDSFDTYSLGSIYNQGGWTGWGGVPSAAGNVTNLISRSAPQSQEIVAAHDSVHTYTGYTTGVWWYTAHIWIPSDFQSGGTTPDTGTYFILLNTYTNGGANTRWSVQFAFDSLDGLIHADAGSSNEVTVPFVMDQWSTIAVRIDLDNDWTQVHYNGTLIDDPLLADHPTLGGGYQWTKGVFGQDTDGLLNIAGVDLYGNGSTSVYYDDMSLGTMAVVTAGIDLFSTPGCGTSQQQFTDPPIPAGFFDPGSDPFDGTICFGGQPLNTEPNFMFYPADTVVRRRADAQLPTIPSTDTVPIEIVALNLVSCNPITVTYNNGLNPEPWNVGVCLSDWPQQLGSMSITKTHANGGTFSSTLPVQPKLIFTRQWDGAVRILDTAAWGIPPLDFNANAEWVHTPEPGFQITVAPPGVAVDANCDGAWEPPLPGTTNFVPGVREFLCNNQPTQRKTLTEEEALLAKHGILPGQYHYVPDSDGDCLLDDADNCPFIYNPFQEDIDGDTVGDVCDNCPTVYNPCQEDSNGNGVGDACESTVDYFTEMFPGTNDLANLSLVFTPNGSADFYAACVRTVTQLPTDPTGGSPLALTDDSFAPIVIGGGHTVQLYGAVYNTLFLGSNGYVTFNAGDANYNESLEAHFNLPRIAALFDDLNPAAGGSVSWKQLSDHIAVTWLNVPEFGTNDQNTFQVELFFNGQVTISYLSLGATDGLAGLSAGYGLPADFVMSNLSEMAPCPITVPAGQDCWHTECGQTQYNFSNTPLPCGFFDPGSEPFDGAVRFGGSSPDGIDTRMNRLEDMIFGPQLPITVVIPLEIAELHLQSCDPIQVRYCNGQPTEPWNVEVELSTAVPPVPGAMSVTKTHTNGGLFSSQFFVQPVFTFRKVTDPNEVRTLDTGAEGIPPVQLDSVSPAPWVHSATINVWPVCGVNFVPGVQEGGVPGMPCVSTAQCCVPVGHGSGQGHLHVTGQICDPCPCGACCLPDGSCMELSSADPAADCAALGGEFKGISSSCTSADGDSIPDSFETNDCCPAGNSCPGSSLCSSPTDPTLADTDGDGLNDDVDPAPCDRCDPVWAPDRPPVCDLYGSDCNGNGVCDRCDIRAGTSFDCNKNGVPDECEPDCNHNSVPDDYDITCGTSADTNQNGIPDECEVCPGDVNCDGIVDFGDINPFVLYLSSFAQWQLSYPGCPPQNGDINADGSYPSFGDINPFVGLIVQSPIVCPP